MVVLKSPITEIEGKVGGTIWRKDQCGQHAQAYPRLIKKRTYSQDQIRKGFADLHNCWSKVMKDRHKSRWWDYSITHPTKNKKGERVTLAGWPMFFKYNQPFWLKGIPPQWLPPGYALPDADRGWYDEWLLQWFLLWGG